MAVAAMLCSVVLLTLGLLVSMALMARYFYGPVELVAGPSCSRLVRANPLFVKGITVRMAEGEQGSEGNAFVLYGHAGGPPRLDVRAAWSEARRVVVPANSHWEWVYFLNRGSQIEVDYSVEPETAPSNHLCIVVAQGKESLMQWSEKPPVHGSAFSWRLVHGAGTVRQTIDSSQEYYVAVGNLNDRQRTVTLDVRVSAVLYDAAAADYACSPGAGSFGCTYRLPILGNNVAILSSRLKEGSSSGSDDDEQRAKVVLSYEPRWMLYFVGSAILAVVLLMLYEVLATMLGFCFCCCCTGGGAAEQRTTATATASLLAADKEEEDASLGSSYDSVSSDGDHDEEVGADEERRRLCVVCCDARRDCFFLPCGHSATCHPCGSRIVVEGDGGGSCPFCRRKLKKVRRIFAV
uniref:Uncharacterized protein n=1 Tax=Avena sativa TaxID=4498 RepID=A0ACD5U1C2_AVESA